jgi:hypothetical protein
MACGSRRSPRCSAPGSGTRRSSGHRWPVRAPGRLRLPARRRRGREATRRAPQAPARATAGYRAGHHAGNSRPPGGAPGCRGLPPASAPRASASLPAGSGQARTGCRLHGAAQPDGPVSRRTARGIKAPTPARRQRRVPPASHQSRRRAARPGRTPTPQPATSSHGRAHRSPPAAAPRQP